jgi:hypothetical protein
MNRSEVFEKTYNVLAGFSPGWQETVALLIAEGEDRRREFLNAWPRGRYVDLFGAPLTDLPPVSPGLSKARLTEVLWEALKANEGGNAGAATFALVRTMVDAELYPVIPSEDGRDRILRANVVKLKAVNAGVAKLRELPSAQAKRQYAAMYLAHPHWLGAAAQRKELYRRYYATVAAFQVQNMGAPQKGEEDEEDDDMDLF